MSRISGLALIVVGMFFLAACGTSTTNPNQVPYQRGQWARPTFGVSQPISLSAVAFAGPDQRVGYACVSTLAAAAPATAATAAPNITPTSTLAIPGRPTPPTKPSQVSNTFWRTANGGVAWQIQTIPPGLPSLLCPVSTVVVPDGKQPNDVFFLAGQGQVDLTSGSPSLPSQVSYQLWRSLNGGLAWQAIPLPKVAGTNSPAILSPYHFIILTHGATIALANNLSGANALYTTTDNGLTWARHSASALAAPGDDPTISRVFAGFAPGPNGTLFSLATTSLTAAPYELWQSADFGTSWSRVGQLPINADPAATIANAQLFSTPDGLTLYTVTHSATAGQVQNTFLGSSNGGLDWTVISWPTSPSSAGAQVGGATIASLGTNFAVDALGNAYLAPNNSDLPTTQDPASQQVAGIYRVSRSAGLFTVSLPIPPPTAANTIVSLTASLVTPTAITPTPGTANSAAATTTATIPATATATDIPATATATTIPTATATLAPVATATDTLVPTATGTATATNVATGTVTPGPRVATPTATLIPVTGLPVLWATFGPSTLLITQPDQGGFFWNILP